MRHALLTEQWFPGIGGSIQLFDALYARHLPAGDHLHVIAGSGPGQRALDAAYPRPVTRFNANRYAWLKPESAVEYASMLAHTLHVCARERIEVLHCARVIPEGLVAMAVHRALGTPYTVWVHGEEVSIYMRYAVKKRLMPRVFNGARAVFANSSFTLGRATIAGAPVEHTYVVNPAVDADAFAGPFDTRALVERWNLQGRTVLLTVGRLTRRKGHDMVLRALARLREKGALGDVAWLVLSDGEIETDLKEQCSAFGLDDVVRWVGPVRRDELGPYYACADLFVMPNRTLDDDDVEGFGMVFLEASAAGVAVIGGRSGGVPDAVSEGVSGLLVDGTSVDDVTGAIDSLLRDPERRKTLGAQGRAWARSFSWERAAERVRAISLGLADPAGDDL
ncbi:MAG: glycosyltransferase family 4 protein [Polyangiales bacterium]